MDREREKDSERRGEIESVRERRERERERDVGPPAPALSQLGHDSDKNQRGKSDGPDTALGKWEHWCDRPTPRALHLYREHQQDALRFNWPADGLVAGTDGGVQERMGEGYAVGTDPMRLVLNIISSC